MTLLELSCDNVAVTWMPLALSNGDEDLEAWPVFEILAEAEEANVDGTEKEITVVSLPVAEAPGEMVGA